MEKQISRIRAETDLRYLAVATSTMDGEAATKVQKALVVENGEVFQLSRNRFEKAEEGAFDKLKSIMT